MRTEIEQRHLWNCTRAIDDDCDCSACDLQRAWNDQAEMLNMGMGIAIREHGRGSIGDWFRRAWAWWNPPQTTASFQHGEW